MSFYYLDEQDRTAIGRRVGQTGITQKGGTRNDYPILKLGIATEAIDPDEIGAIRLLQAPFPLKGSGDDPIQARNVCDTAIAAGARVWVGRYGVKDSGGFWGAVQCASGVIGGETVPCGDCTGGSMPALINITFDDITIGTAGYAGAADLVSWFNQTHTLVMSQCYGVVTYDDPANEISGYISLSKVPTKWTLWAHAEKWDGLVLQTDDYIIDYSTDDCSASFSYAGKASSDNEVITFNNTTPDQAPTPAPPPAPLTVAETFAGFSSPSAYTTGDRLVSLEPTIKVWVVDGPLDAPGTSIEEVGPMGDQMLEIAKGNVTDHSSVNKFGRNTDVDTTPEDIWDGGGTWTAPTQARIHDIASTSVNDDANGGTGARRMEIHGLTSWFSDPVSEEIELNGTSNVATTNAYVIIHRMYVTAKGTSNVNAGTITATAQTDSTVTAQINAGEGQTQMAVFGVSATQELYMTRWYSSINRASTGEADIEALWNCCPEAELANFQVKGTIGLTTSGVGALELTPSPPARYSGPGIMKIQATGGQNNNDISAGFDGVLVARAFDPAVIQGCVLHLRAEDLALSNGAKVTSWTDRVSGKVFANSTTDQQPLYQTAGIGGQPSVLFDGSDDILTLDDTIGAYAQTGTIFAVWNSVSNASPHDYFFCYGAGNTSNYHVITAFRSGYAELLNTAAGTTNQIRGNTLTNTTGVDHYAMWASSGTAYEIRLDGAAQAETVGSGTNDGQWLGDATLDRMSIGAWYYSSVAQWANIHISEIIVFDTYLRSSEVSAVEAYLAAKYGI